MRRSLTRVAAALVAATAVLAGCWGPGQPEPAPGRSFPPIGDPNAVPGVVDTSPPTPTLRAAVPTIGPLPVVTTGNRAGTGGTGTGSAAPVGPPAVIDPAAASLAACLVGNWSAPVAREYQDFGVTSRSLGAVRGGTGLLRLTLGKDQNWTFTYDQVVLELAAGKVLVNGPVAGTWTLRGNTLRTQLISRQTKVSLSVGPVTVPAPTAVAMAVETLPPGEVFVTCSPESLSMQLPTSSGGGTVDFDRA